MEKLLTKLDEIVCKFEDWANPRLKVEIVTGLVLVAFVAGFIVGLM